MSCENNTADSAMETLDQMLEKHRAIATYRVYRFEPRKPRGKQKTYLKPFGLHWDDANVRRDALNAALKAEGKDRFTDPLYGLDLENGWECMPQAARERHLLLGKGPKNFTLSDGPIEESEIAESKPADLSDQGANP